MTTALAANGRMPGLRKYALAVGWVLIDDTEGTRTAIPGPEEDGGETQPLTKPGSATTSALLGHAQEAGWHGEETNDQVWIDLGLKQRTRAAVVSCQERDPAASLCLEVLPAGESADIAVMAFALSLTALQARVRASLLDLGEGPRLVWETPVEPSAVQGHSLTAALLALTEIARHGQAEARLLANDQATAERWLNTNLPTENPN